MEKRAGGFKVRRPGSRAGSSFCQTIESADILLRTCSKMVLSITRKYKPLPLKVIFLCIPTGTFDNDLSRPWRTSLCKSREAGSSVDLHPYSACFDRALEAVQTIP